MIEEELKVFNERILNEKNISEVDISEAFNLGVRKTKEEFNKKIEELERYYIRKKWIRPNTWELFYPDGTSRLMNFNPLEEQRKKLKKKIKELKNLWREKCKRMEIMSGDVAIYELEKLIEELNNEGKE